MKKILAFVFIINSLLLASDSLSEEEKKKIRLEKQIKIEEEREKKFAREQTFYTSDRYDFKGSEVNEETVESLDEIKVDSLDMDSVYD